MAMDSPDAALLIARLEALASPDAAASMGPLDRGACVFGVPGEDPARHRA
jgi:hypothetical protein